MALIRCFNGLETNIHLHEWVWNRHLVPVFNWLGSRSMVGRFVAKWRFALVSLATQPSPDQIRDKGRAKDATGRWVISGRDQ